MFNFALVASFVMTSVYGVTQCSIGNDFCKSRRYGSAIEGFYCLNPDASGTGKCYGTDYDCPCSVSYEKHSWSSFDEPSENVGALGSLNRNTRSPFIGGSPLRFRSSLRSPFRNGRLGFDDPFGPFGITGFLG